MLEAGKIDGRQATFLMITVFISEGILFAPSATLTLARQDAWISNIIALMGGLISAWAWVSLSRRFPGKTLFEINQVVFGRFIGKIIGFIYIWGWLSFTANILAEYIFLLVADFMPETPLVVFSITAVLITSYSAYSGLENFSRINQIIVPVALLSIIILFFLSAPEFNFNNILPVFDAGILQIVKGSFIPMFWLCQIITLTNLIPFLNKPEDSFKIAAKSIFIGWLIFELVAVGIVVIFGPVVASSYIAPVLNGVRMIHIANFLERLELILMIIWIATGIVKIALYQWVVSLGSAQLMGLNSYRPLVTPIGILIVTFSIWLNHNIIQLFNFINFVWGNVYGLGYVLIFPFLLLLTVSLLGKGGRS